ncbi:zinc finger BED domain-containing protein RICESLEEPER 2-like [Senna tora]|uniref:Zinc finger BED domain-containing protein RICESLEEPER 2-like n=1 Tax=Senna tora TaxID=362788 RepID=A0A834X7N1_9FABA|nr:zinc finger BED domain-containing protein RICESLEEPER 2-like [Senna tora]
MATQVHTFLLCKSGEFQRNSEITAHELLALAEPVIDCSEIDPENCTKINWESSVVVNGVAIVFGVCQLLHITVYIETDPQSEVTTVPENEENNSGSSSSAPSEGKNGEAQKRAKGINLSKSKKRKRKEKEPIQRNEEPNRRPVRPSSWVWKFFTEVEGCDPRFPRAAFQNMNYLVLTAHFIDIDWKLHKRTLNFCPIENHRGETIGKAIESCLIEWGIEKVFTITVDNASSNDVVVSYLRGKINGWNGSVLRGDYLHVRCVAHILNLVVNDGLKYMHESITKIRNAVRYVRASPARMKKFKECVEKEKIQSTSMVQLDVPTRWNSTYLMLDSALKFEKAFSRYESQDAHYVLEHLGEGKRRGIPAREDWENARIFVKFLKVFYDVTTAVSGTLFVTSSNYFHDFCLVMKTLKGWCESEDDNLRRMAEMMKEKHDKYWGNITNINILLFVAVLLDPRYKFKFVEWSFGKIFDVEVADSMSWKVKNGLYKMYDYYKLCFGSNVRLVPTQSNQSRNKAQTNQEDDRNLFAMEFDRDMNEEDNPENKSEIDQYLLEPREKMSSQFDILNWWKVNSTKFPILALIARDVLAMPISTIASESAFSTGGRVIDTYRSSLAPKTIEALISAQNWFRSKPLSMEIEECADDIEKLELGGDNGRTSESGKQVLEG